MKFSLRTLLFLVLIAGVALSGLINPVIGRREAKSILDQCGGLWWRVDPQNIEYEYEKLSLFDEVRAEWSRLAIKGAVISPVPDEAYLLRSFLSQHRGLRGLETLSILSDKTIPSKNYRPIKGLRDLRFLRIKNATLDRSCFKSISKIEDLENLLLLGCTFDAEDLAELKSSSHLAWVHINDENIDVDKLNKARESLEKVRVTLGDFDTPVDFSSL